MHEAAAQRSTPGAGDGAVRCWLSAIMLLGAAAAALLGFMMYGMGRSIEFGGTWALAGRFLLVSPLFLLPPVVFAISGQYYVCELHERVWSHRLAAGRCPACGHPLPAPPSEVCTECGTARLTPHRITGRGRVYWRTAAAAVVGACVGAGVVEIIMSVDEARFRREVDARPLTGAGFRAVYSRQRTWPFENSSLVWTPASGFHGTD
jgi:hypothetical protein